MRILQNSLFQGAFFVILMLPFIVASCNKKETAPPPPPKVKVINVWQTTVPVPVDYVGQTYGYKDIPIRARVDGFLTGMYFQEGTMIKKGQLLYTIDPEPLKAIEAEKLSGLAEAQSRLVEAESNLKRIKPWPKSMRSANGASTPHSLITKPPNQGSKLNRLRWNTPG